MNEIDEMLIKIKDKGCIPDLLGPPSLNEKARRLMDVFPETSSWETSAFKELFKKLENRYKKEALSDHL